MRPETSTVSLRKDLSAVVQEYDLSGAAAKFVAPQIAPVVVVPEAAGNYPVWRRDAFKKPASTARAEGSGYNRIQGQFGTGSFTCEEHGLEYLIDDRMRRRYMSFFDAEVAATKILRSQLMIAWERRVAAVFTGASLTNHSASVAWHTSATAVPITDIQSGVDTICDACGCAPTDVSLIVPRAGYREMLATTQVANKLQYTYPGIIPAQLAAQQAANMLGIGSVIVTNAAYDSASEGAAESNTQIWGSTIAYIAKLAKAGDPLESPAAIRTIVWAGDGGGDGMSPTVESYRDDTRRGDVVRMREDTDEVLLGTADLLFVYQLTF